MTAQAKIVLMVTAGALVLSACTMAPRYERGALPVPDQFANAPAATAASAETLPWKQVILDTRLQAVIDQALANNRDLRIAVLNVERAQQQYRIQRADLFPAVSGSVAGTRGDIGAPGGKTDVYTADIGASWQLDLFGRVRSLDQAALQTYFASQANSNAARISLVSAVASAWLNLAADQDQLKLSQSTLASRQQSLDIVQKRFDLGTSDQLTLRQTQILANQARSDAATLQASVQQDLDALRLLVGADVSPDTLPTTLPEDAVLSDLPVGLPSQVLLKRPDVVAAEDTLKAANADIGAARAAFFPSISLTGSVGKASTDLDHLFDGADTWSFTPQVSVPIFAGGANLANLRSAKTGRDIAVAQYEGAIQQAFRDVSDQLATRATIDDRLGAQTQTVDAANDSLTIAQARFDRGVDSLLTLTDAQRTLYGAQQQLIATRLVRELNLVNLYAAVGGGL